MSLNRRERENTAAELAANLELSGLTEADAAAAGAWFGVPPRD